MSPEIAFTIAFAVFSALLGALYRMHTSQVDKIWKVLDKTARTEELVRVSNQLYDALKQQRDDFLERNREMSERQDREVEALKTSMEAVKREIHQNHVQLMERLQELTLLIRSRE